MENKIQSLLYELGISDEQSTVPFYPKVRDRGDISVLKCQKSGVIFLSRTDHLEISHYENKVSFRDSGIHDRKMAILSGQEDASRRFEQFKNIIANKKWVDVGAGAGGILDLLSPIASETVAVEPQELARKNLLAAGYKAFSSVSELPDDNFDVATLFH